jgi:DNA-nicking Smr family endonuclease
MKPKGPKQPPQAGTPSWKSALKSAAKTVAQPAAKTTQKSGQMSAQKSGAKPAPGALTGDEQALWRYVATSITPIKAKHHVRKHGAAIEPSDDAETPLPPRSPSRAKSAPAPVAPMPNARLVATTPARATPALADFDPRKAKKISTGRAGIDARLDLHGMRQDDALAHLRSFLFDAHARGHKTVLVITGKGRAADDPTTPYVDTLDRHPRGVLRRNLPHWLAEPDLRPIIVSYTQASQRHGGDGAFYVELRRKR